MRRARFLIASFVLACGARTALDIPETEDSAATDAVARIDAEAGAEADDADASQDVEVGVDACALCNGSCVDGRCITVLASGPAWHLAVDDSNVYWTVPMPSGEVRAVPKNGGTPITLATQQPEPRAITTDGVNVYWSDTFALMRVPVGGGAPTVFVAQDYAASMALDGEDLYWTNSTANTVMRAPLAGGPPVVLASNQSYVQGIAIDDSAVFWACPGTQPKGYTDGWVGAAPKAGGAMQVLADNLALPDSIAVDSTRAYWTSNTGQPGAVLDVMIGGGNVNVLAGSLGHPNDIVSDAASIYWTNQGTYEGKYADGAVMKMPLGGGTAETVASTQNNASGVVVDDTSVYWIAGNQIMKATPK